MGRISIVMAVYNGEKYLKEQIDSLVLSSYTDWTLEICDDGSKDGTVSIGREYEKQYPGKIRVHENRKNLGVTKNFLEGARRAEGEYIMFCDQDDVWLPDKISKTYQYMKKMEHKYGTGPVAVFTDAKVVDQKLNGLEPSFHKSNRLDCKKLDLPQILMENKLIGCTIMFNGALKEKLENLPDEARVHDWWIALIAAAFGKIGYLNEATLLYRQHENNVIGGQNFISYMKSRITSLGNQKRALSKTQAQARNFYDLFCGELPENQKEVLYEFASLGQKNWFTRRKRMIKYGFWKTGVIRNIGVFLLI